MSTTIDPRGKSLTPAARSEEVTRESFKDGLISGALCLIPSGAAVWYLTNYSSKFRKVTNYQSRTALVIMPPLFMFGVASEMKLQHLMHKMAGEAEHHSNVSEWAHKHMDEVESRRKQTEGPSRFNPMTEEEREHRLAQLYHKSIGGSDVRIVPGSQLGLHHRFANYWQENPFKILAGLGIPSVGYIFYKRNKKAHLDLQQQIMHSRVVGQFTVLIFLLSLMGFKEYMDRNGTFITEEEALRRVEEMKIANKELQYRIAEDLKTTEHTMELVRKAQGEDAATTSKM